MLKKQQLSLLKWFFQLTLFFASLFLIAEGLWGHQFAPANPTTQLIWVHYRGFLMLALLLAGNFFCYACPFMFFRDLARLFVSPRWLFPKVLRNKWTAMFFFAAVLFGYEYFSLWASPFKTAVFILIYFGAALVIDLLFKHASFCKYICPIGHFNFLTSTLSPREVQVQSQQKCLECKTLDCIKGNETSRGCELHLFLPTKTGNLDCTFCMDCVKACPKDNITLARVLPGASLGKEHRKWEGRWDHQLSVLMFFFLGLLNALLMTAPAEWLRQQVSFASLTAGAAPSFFSLLLFFVVFALILPLLFFVGPLRFFQSASSGEKHAVIFCLLPLGVGLWSAHYSFHFLTGLLAFVPLLGLELPTRWMGLSPAHALPVEMGLVFLGGALSFMLLHKRVGEIKLKVYASTLYFFLAAVSVWVLLQPMQMRSTFMGVVP